MKEKGEGRRVCLTRKINDLPTYPGVPQAVDMTLPTPSIFDSPKSLIIILESSSIL